MNSFSTFTILEDRKIILEYCSGPLTKEELIKMKLREKTHPDFCLDYNTFTDIRDTSIGMHKQDVYYLIDFVRNNPELYGNIRMAFLTSKPIHVVAVTLLSLYKGDLHIQPKVFSTIKSALPWVTNSSEVDEYIADQIKFQRDTVKRVS